MDVRGKIISKKPAHKVLALLASSVALLVLPFFKSELAWPTFVSIVPMFFALEAMHKQHWSQKKIILAIWLSGWLYTLFVTFWMLQIDTDQWSYATNVPLDALIVLTWLACSLVLSVGFMLFGLLIVTLKAQKTVLRFTLMVPAAWVLGEFVRSWLTSLAFIGPEGTLGAFYSFGSLGFAAINTPFGYTSRLIGLFGLSFLVVVINICIYMMIKRQFRLPIILISFSCFIALIGYWAYSSIKPILPTKNVAVVQLDIENRVSYDAELVNILHTDKSAGSYPADVVVLPEYANFFEQGGDENRSSVIQNLTGGHDALFVYSRILPGPRRLKTNQIVYKTNEGTELSTQEKNFLIPTGEYLPYVHRFILKVIGHDQVVNIFNANTGFAKGEPTEHPVVYDSVSFGTLVCSGAIAPQLYREMAAQGAEVLINSAALGVFKDSPLYREQSESMVRFNAIANVKPFIQSARGNYSYVFDHNGKTLAHTSELGIGVITAKVQPSNTKTLYTKFGEFMILVSLVILVVFCIHNRKQPLNKKSLAKKRKHLK